jgi:hypothetical protein
MECSLTTLLLMNIREFPVIDCFEYPAVYITINVF